MLKIVRHQKTDEGSMVSISKYRIMKLFQNIHSGINIKNPPKEKYFWIWLVNPFLTFNFFIMRTLKNNMQLIRNVVGEPITSLGNEKDKEFSSSSMDTSGATLDRKIRIDSINEIKISYKEKRKVFKSNAIKNSASAAQILFKYWNSDTIGLYESFKVLLLNNSNKVKGVYQLSTGGITGTLVDIRILFAVIVKTLSVGIILAHNHPSGKLIPSEADKRLTEKIKKAAAFFDVKVLDHLIIAPDGSYYSFADSGIL